MHVMLSRILLHHTVVSLCWHPANLLLSVEAEHQPSATTGSKSDAGVGAGGSRLQGDYSARLEESDAKKHSDPRFPLNRQGFVGVMANRHEDGVAV